MEHIKNLLQKLSKDLELIEDPKSSQIDIDVCLNSIRQLYDQVRNIGEKTIQTSSHLEKDNNLEVKNNTSTIENSEIDLDEIDFSDEKPVIEAEENINNNNDISKEINDTVSEEKEEAVNQQEQETVQSQNTTKASNAQVDLFANITNSNNGSSEKQVTLGEHLGANKRSLNETFAGKQDMASRLNKKPVTDIKTAIGIGDRFLFIKELFGGDNEKFNQTIEVLNGLTDYDQALEHIKSNFSWNIDDSTAQQFLNIVSRKYQ